MRKLVSISEPEREALQEVLLQFAVEGRLAVAERLYQGHLHATYIGEWELPGGKISRFIHQNINTEAFQETAGMLQNTAVVLEYINGHEDYCFPERLVIVPTKDGKPFYQTGKQFWRTYEYVEESISYDICSDIEKARSLGEATGNFLFLLGGLKPDKLVDHSPGFQDTNIRWSQHQQAIASSSKERLQLGTPLSNEMLKEFPEAKRISDAIQAGSLPRQVIHGDTKVNNFLFRESSNEVLCLVDIDLCMLGSSLIDYGDLIRSASAVGREDEPDLSQVGVNREVISGITEGFLASNLSLTPAERELLPLAGFTISFNLTVRFLTDFLLGDRYFPAEHEQHNLERAKAQWKVTQHLYSSQEVIRDLL